jgi:putative transposase
MAWPYGSRYHTNRRRSQAVDTLTLRPADRQGCLELFRAAPDHATRQRALILLLLSAGVSYAALTAALGCSSATTARWAGRYRAGGLPALTAAHARPSRLAPWVALVVGWVLTLRPRAFGFARSRWSCEAVAVVLREDHQVHVGREAVRLALRAAGLVWRRPRPAVRRKDPDREAKLAALRRLLGGLPEGETAVFMDEVEVHTNPKVGSAWMRRGEQAVVETPGDNEKRVLAGSLHWRTGRLVRTWGAAKEGRTAGLFCAHLDDLRRAFRQYKVIHVVCDNAFNHRPEKSRQVKAYLAAWGHRVVIHFLPLYAPECNPIEEVWWRLHEAVTRNHRCASMGELIDLTLDWLEERPFFRARRKVYTQP